MFTLRSLDAIFFPATVIEASIGQANGAQTKQERKLTSASRSLYTLAVIFIKLKKNAK